LAKRLTRLSGFVPLGAFAAMWGNCVLLLPTMPLMSAARVWRWRARLACGLSRIGLHEGVADGTIAAKVVTHRQFLLFSIADGVYDEPTFKQDQAKNKIMSIDSIG